MWWLANTYLDWINPFPIPFCLWIKVLLCAAETWLLIAYSFYFSENFIHIKKNAMLLDSVDSEGCEYVCSWGIEHRCWILAIRLMNSYWVSAQVIKAKNLVAFKLSWGLDMRYVSQSGYIKFLSLLDSGLIDASIQHNSDGVKEICFAPSSTGWV